VVINEVHLTFPELCHSCGGCIEICPENAITETGRELGVVETGQKENVDFTHGRLRIGETMAPPLIRQVRSHAQNDKLVIIDAPPGTSCPVISAMKKTDFVLLVTEPTPFGLHDLLLAVEAVKVLGLPHGLIINRSDLGDERVKAYAEKEQLPILMEIPFDRQIAETYSRGELVIEGMPEWRPRFLGLFEKIKELLGERSN
jgi:MinD superfamily P-loop ATPase